jgi:hypothetical protein
VFAEYCQDWKGEGALKIMNMRRAGVSVLACLFVLLASPLVSVVSAAVPGVPHSADSMWIEPALVTLSSDTVSVGYRFNVTVWINLTVASASWQSKLAYNKNHLNATKTGYTAGDKSDFLSNITTIPLSAQLGSLNATHNYVLSAESWMLGPTRSPGYGSLVWVEFEVMAVPPPGETFTSQIGMVDVYPAGTETYAQTPTGDKIPINVYYSTYIIPEFPSFLIAILLACFVSTTLILAKSRKNTASA